MTAQPGTPRKASQPPALHFSVTHVGLRTSQIDNVRQEDRRVEINFTAPRAVLLALNAIGGMPEVRQLKHFFAWPLWQAPGIPTATHEWKAIFGIKDRAFEGIHGAAPEGGQPTIIRAPTHIRVTDAMWEMLQAQGCVVLCTGLAGDPTAADIGAAAGNRKLQAVLAEALLH
ncbi:hypothetical protein [Streptomyces sp. NBC_01578]|uniref:hypothetical protein n=1 Tax=Streptomyces sp. NBC_01578 TaxID=2975884 RepID=UPI0038680E5D